MQRLTIKRTKEMLRHLSLKPITVYKINGFGFKQKMTIDEGSYLSEYKKQGWRKL